MAEDVDDFLAHYGIQGMKWGQRKAAVPGVSARTSREARKDANEFAKAKMFYGDGAGTRRKLIKAKVESKSSKDPAYKKAFDHHLGNQDLGKRASQARGERARKDTVATTAKTARGVKNLVMKTGAPVTLGALAVYGAAQNPAIRNAVVKGSKTVYSTVKNSNAVNTGANFVKNLWR